VDHVKIHACFVAGRTEGTEHMQGSTPIFEKREPGRGHIPGLHYVLECKDLECSMKSQEVKRGAIFVFSLWMHD
jgi:hypothetical protein